MAKLVTIASALALLAPALLSGQNVQGTTRLGIERGELTRLLDQFESVVESTGYSDVLREEAQLQADLIRERLSNGDFQVGGRIALSIELDGVDQWDTLTVEAGPAIDVPTLGSIPLGGILRSELQSHVTAEVARFIQDPRVRVRALIRVSLAGVGRPGFHTVPADLPLSEAVMLAGGPVAGADPGQIRIERGQDVVWSTDELLGPVADGRTLDELGVQAGDRIILEEDPAMQAGGGGSVVMRQVIQSLSFVLVPTLIGLIN